MMARKVENPPWNTEEPMELRALRALYYLFSVLVKPLGGITIRYVWAIWAE